MDAVIALTLLTLSVSLVVATRQSGATLLLATFLLLVGVNIGATAIAQGMGSASSVPSSFLGLSRANWHVTAYLALVLDPVYLLLFTTAYPYRTRSRGTWALIGASGVIALFLVTALLVDPEPFLTRVFGGNQSWLFALMIGNLAVAYVASWFLSVRRLALAPTPLLERQCRWLVVAVGIAVLPRLGFVPVETGLLSSLVGRSYPAMPGFPYWILGVASVFGALALLAHVRDGERFRKIARPVGIVLAAVAGFVGLVALTEWSVLSEMYLLGRGREALRFGWRWVAFSGILAYGIAVFDAVESRRAVTVVLPRAAGVVGAGAAALVAFDVLSGSVGTVEAVVGAVIAGLAAALPTTLLVRRAITVLAPPGVEGDAARRLTLYQAAVEAAADSDGATRAADLRASRRTLGVSAEEARVVEQLVLAARERDDAPLHGEVLPGVVVERSLGAAAHGGVYLASRPALGDRVVVKELALRTGDASARRRALREYGALSNVTHPNVLRVLDVHVRRGRVLLVREFVPGRTLADLLREDGPGIGLASRVADGVLGALVAAHETGLVHRDVKPQNVLVGDDGRVRLFDFDVAVTVSAREPAGAQATFASLDGVAASALVGTPAYMAPEQSEGRAATASSDLFSVGLVAFEALTGRRATALAPAADAARVVENAADVPAPWRTFLQRALAADPVRRFPDARAMRAAVPLVLEDQERAADAKQVARAEDARRVRLE